MTILESIITLAVMLVVFSTSSVGLSRGINVWRRAVSHAAKMQVRCLVAERICAETRAADKSISYQYYSGKVRREKGKSAAYLSNEGEVGSLTISKTEEKAYGVSLDGFTYNVLARN